MPIQPTRRPGQPITARDLNRLARGSAVTTGGRGVAVNRTGSSETASFIGRIPGVVPAGSAGSALLVQVVAEHNDHIACLFVASQEPVNVAKPFKLRHVLANYDALTTLTTSAVNEVDVGDGAVTETWKVTLDYDVGDQFMAIRTAGTGVIIEVEVDGGALIDTELEWLDISARAWAKVT